MADFSQLKAAVANVIKTNGNEEITGAILQDVLLTIINSIAGGYMFGGVAQHSGNVGNPDYNVFYLAGSGSYTGYGNAITIENGCYGVFRYNGSWTQEVVDIGVRLSGSVSAGETRGCTGDTINTALQTLFDNITSILDTLSFVYNTPSAQQATKAMLDAQVTIGSQAHVLGTLTLVSATALQAGLLSAEDKQKIDAFLTNLRSLVFADTTAVGDVGTKITETMSATIEGNAEVIATFTLLAATASKAGLMSATDKTYLDSLPAALLSIVNTASDNLSMVLAMLGYYECSTAAATAAKEVSASGYVLTNGGCIRIKMTNANTADSVTLNINSTGAKALYYDGAQASATNSWEAGEVLEVFYDGTQYQCASGGGGKFATGENIKDVGITDQVAANSDDLPTSGAVYEAVNVVYDFTFDNAYQFYINSSTHEKVNSSSFRSLIIPNDNYHDCIVHAGFNDTVPFAISFFNSTAIGATSFISGVQSLGGNVLKDYTAVVPSGCKTIVLTTRTGYNAASASIVKNIQGIDKSAGETYILQDMVSLDDLVLINKDANSTSVKTATGIDISSVAAGGRSGFKFGTLPDGGYYMEFDLTSDSTAASFTLNFADGTANALFTDTILNNSHAKVQFNATSSINSAYLSTSQIGAGKTVHLTNIRIYKRVSIDEYAADVATQINALDARIVAVEQATIQEVGDEDTYTGDVVNKFIGTNYEYTTHSSFATYEIPNAGYEKIHVSAGNKDNGAYALAFYSTTSVSAAGFISGQKFVVGQHDYDADIPSNCQLICVSSRIFDSNYDYTLSYKLYSTYNRAKIDIDTLSQRVQALENEVNTEDSSDNSVVVPYLGNEVSFVRRYKQQGYLFSELTSVGDVGYGQGFAYSNGYMFFASNGGTVRIWKYQPSDPNLTFKKQYNLASAATTNHANSLNFGAKYDAGDEFPLLYISECYGSQGCFVERVTLNGSTLIQTITLSTVSTHFGLFVNWIPDLKRNRLLAIGVIPDSRTNMLVLEFNLPSTSQQTVTLTDSDIVKSYNINNDCLFQGCAIYKDVLMLPVGQSADQHIIFYDLVNNTIINSVPVSDDVGEPEDAYVVDDNVILFAANGVYKLEFDNMQLPYDLDKRISDLEDRIAALES